MIDATIRIICSLCVFIASALLGQVVFADGPGLSWILGFLAGVWVTAIWVTGYSCEYIIKERDGK